MIVVIVMMMDLDYLALSLLVSLLLTLLTVFAALVTVIAVSAQQQSRCCLEEHFAKL